jgi:hypothetical protein
MMRREWVRVISLRVRRKASRREQIGESTSNPRAALMAGFVAKNRVNLNRRARLPEISPEFARAAHGR